MKYMVLYQFLINTSMKSIFFLFFLFVYSHYYVFYNADLLSFLEDNGSSYK